MAVIILTRDPGDLNDGIYLDEPPCPECKRGRLIREPASEYDVQKLTCVPYAGFEGENCASVFQLEPQR